MKSLVLGGTQFMGVHMVNELIAAGHEVTIATRGKSPDPFGNKVNRLIIDRQDPSSLSGALKGKQYDVTIDNIAYASNDIKYLLDVLQTKKYVLTSTEAVYSAHFHDNMQEDEFDPKTFPLKWCNYENVPYDEGKRQAEAALFQSYPNQQSAAVRFPFIFGDDDFTKRLFFYIEHIFHERPMHVNNLTARMTFINSQEAGQFLAHAATSPVSGCVNACSNGIITLEEIISYTQKLTSKKAVIQESGTPAPLNSTPDCGQDNTKATKTGFNFRDINDWVYPLIDHWVSELTK